MSMRALSGMAAAFAYRLKAVFARLRARRRANNKEVPPA